MFYLIIYFINVSAAFRTKEETSNTLGITTGKSYSVILVGIRFYEQTIFSMFKVFIRAYAYLSRIRVQSFKIKKFLYFSWISLIWGSWWILFGFKYSVKILVIIILAVLRRT
jgi:hypothetical protein